MAWFDVIEMRRVILIDTPDYSKTDKRRMDRDLTDISRFWNHLATNRGGPSIVVAIQQEMFHDHFFLGKMRKVELVPLSADQMLRAYRLRFDTLEPFAEEALLTLTYMSRGIFRRFKNYISLTLDLWISEGRSGEIDPATVRRAISIERITEDMELELKPLFPKHSELSIMAVRVILNLEENGPQNQSYLATKFEMEAFEMSRLLNKLESVGYVRRHRDGTDKIVEAINPVERRTAGYPSIHSTKSN
jgi:DNA-binding MarR family transcriptional regulator